MIGFMKKEYLAGSTGFLLAVNIFKVDARKKFKGMSVFFKENSLPRQSRGARSTIANSFKEMSVRPFFSCPFLNSLILFLCSSVFVFLSGLGVILSLRRVTTSAEVRIGYLALQRDAFYIDSHGFHESSHMYRPVCEKPWKFCVCTSELTSYLY